MSTLIGIDQSYTSTGFCVFDLVTGNVINFGTIGTKKTDGDIFQRSTIIAEKIMHLTQKYNTTAVILEGLAFGMRGSATRDLAGLQFVIVNALRTLKIDTTLVSPLSLKKFATGMGRASKDDMVKALPSHIATQFDALTKAKGLYDVVDSFWLGSYGCAQLSIKN